MKTQTLYLNSHQSRKREPTQYENLLGDAIERGFAAGHWELAALVAYLNQSGPRAPSGEAWTEAGYQVMMQRLAQEA
jgi:hypothetical protein